MSFDAHANLASSLVSVAPSPATSGTSLAVQPGQAAYFPAVPFNCTVCPVGVLPSPLNAEIVRVTSIAGDIFTIIRAQEGTTAMPIAEGYYIGNSITVKTLTDIQNAIVNYVTPPPVNDYDAAPHPSIAFDSSYIYWTDAANSWLRAAGAKWSSAFTYLRPDGTSTFLRPDGTSLYVRP